MDVVIIGMDPHKRSATIEVMGSDECVLGRGRYGTHESGYRAMVRAVRHWPERTNTKSCMRAPTWRTRWATRSVTWSSTGHR
jgi:hypothetical protein